MTTGPTSDPAAAPSTAADDPAATQPTNRPSQGPAAPAPAAAPTVVAAHVPNLFDRSRFDGRARFVDTPDQAAACGPDVLIVDLDRCDDLEAFRIPGPRLIGFGPHADTVLHDRALAAGYDEVLPRSVVFRRLPQLLASAQGR